MRKLTSIILILSLLLLTCTGLQADAPKDAPKVFHGNELKNTPAFVQDEVIVKFKNDKHFRVMKVPAGLVLEKVSEYSRLLLLSMLSRTTISKRMQRQTTLYTVINGISQVLIWNRHGMSQQAANQSL